jgi:hypothetical protein
MQSMATSGQLLQKTSPELHTLCCSTAQLQTHVQVPGIPACFGRCRVTISRLDAGITHDAMSEVQLHRENQVSSRGCAQHQHSSSVQDQSALPA